MIMKGETALKANREYPLLQSVKRRAVRGFTLIELMVVVAVVAILAAVAYPSYQDQIRKSRRAQAKADMVEYAQLAERWHTVNNTYAGFNLTAAQSQSPREGGVARYTLRVTPPAPTQNAFTLTAIPQGPQAVDRCGTLTLNQAGAKQRSGAAPFNECW